MGIIQVSSNACFNRMTRKGLVLVGFYASWCAPCHIQEAIVRSLSGRFIDRVRFAWVDVDASPKIAAKFDIAHVPTLIIFCGGVGVQRLVGLYPEEIVAAAMEKYI